MYQEKLDESLKQYEVLKKEYDELTQSATFSECISSLPFDFIKASYIMNVLSTFNESGGRMIMKFEDAQEAMSLFRKVIGFKKDAEKILDKAAYLHEVSALTDKINTLVSGTPYLSASFALPDFGRLHDIADACLTDIPDYKKLKTKAFLIGFIESCVESLSQPELSKVLASGYIKGDDLDRIRLTGSKAYEDNIAYLREITGHNIIPQKVYTTRIKGVSKPDKNGINRQVYLKNIAQSVKNGETPVFKAEVTAYTPPETGVEEPAIRLYWRDKFNLWQDIGFIPKELAKEITENFTSPVIKPMFKEIVGGGQVTYGCNISVMVGTPVKQKDLTCEMEK